MTCVAAAERVFFWCDIPQDTVLTPETKAALGYQEQTGQATFEVGRSYPLEHMLFTRLLMMEAITFAQYKAILAIITDWFYIPQNDHDPQDPINNEAKDNNYAL